MKKTLFAAIAALLVAAQAFAQGFPAYLKMEGTKITGCDKDALPENLVIPEGVTEIGPEAFYGCESLESVEIPRSVTKIGSFAFSRCDNMELWYYGTKAQWNMVSKFAYIGTPYVHCNDGETETFDSADPKLGDGF